MNYVEMKDYLSTCEGLIKPDEKKAFLYNFACVLTKNSVGMESGKNAHLEEVVSAIKGCQTHIEENLKRDLYNHYKGVLYLNELVSTQKPLNQDVLKDLHAILTKGITDIEGLPIGGVYRKVNISVNGSKYIPCDHVKVYKRMNEYFDTLAGMKPSLEKAVYAHLQLAKIHPFLDGNGRTCRLVLNYYLMEAGILPISIPSKRRLEYFDTLEAYKVDKNSEPFKEFLVDLVTKEYVRYLELLNN